MADSQREPDESTGVSDEIIEQQIRTHGLVRRVAALRRLYEWVLGWAETRHAGKAMGLLAFAEAIFFPVPADVLLAALCLGRPRKSFRWATICTSWSIVGGTTALLLGLAVGEARVVAALEWVGLGEKGAEALRAFNEWGFWAVAVAALTPVPYMVFSWVAGFAEIAVWQFLLASVIFRSMRFFGVGGIMYVFGPRAKRFIDRYFNLATVVFMALLIGVIVLVRLLRG